MPGDRPKDPGYKELNKRSSKQQDLFSKEFRDNQARIIHKVDESHGLINGGIIGQMTHGGESQYHSSPFKNSLLYRGSRFDQTACLPNYSKLSHMRRQMMSAQNIATTPKTEMEKKILLVKKMIKNERKANEMITN